MHDIDDIWDDDEDRATYAPREADEPVAATAATPTPEELARTAWTNITKEMGNGPFGFEAEEIIAAAIRQHSEAQRAEIERLTKERDSFETKYLSEEGRAGDAEGDVFALREDCSAALARATTAEAALAAMTAERDEWQQRWSDHGNELATIIAKRDEHLSASQERERKMREALKTAMRLVEEYGCRTDVSHIADDCDIAVAMCRAAFQPQETADER